MGMKILTVFAVCFTFSTAIAYAYQAEFEYREGVMVGVGIGPSGFVEIRRSLLQNTLFVGGNFDSRLLTRIAILV